VSAHLGVYPGRAPPCRDCQKVDSLARNHPFRLTSFLLSQQVNGDKRMTVRTPLALAVACAASLLGHSAAQAQTSTVSVYGIVDAGIEYRTQNNAKGDGQWRLNSGGLNTSRLGFKGTEDLGGGLSAQFNLESEVVLDSGATGSAFFGRQAWVGLEDKDLGGLAFGRMSTAIYDYTLAHDFMGYAPQYSWLTATASVPATGFTSRIGNAIRYSNKFGAFKVTANAGLGEVAGSLNANTQRGVSVGYEAGALSAQLSYDDARTAATETATTSTSNRSLIASGSYKLDTVKLYGGVRATQRKPVGTVSASNPRYRSDLFWFGASAPLSQAITAFGGVYFENKHGTSSDPVMLAGKLHYNLSKRTWLYATASVARAKSDDGTQTLTGVFRDQTPVSGNQTGIGFGIQHRF
jgi:predicted porin